MDGKGIYGLVGIGYGFIDLTYSEWAVDEVKGKDYYQDEGKTWLIN